MGLTPKCVCVLLRGGTPHAFAHCQRNLSMTLPLPAPPSTAAPITAIRVGELVKIQSPMDWIIPDLLPARSLIIVAGESKLARKSLLLEWLATRVAQGLPFLDKVLPYARPVIYSALEESVEDSADRMRRFGILPGSETPLTMCFDDETEFSGVAESIAYTQQRGLWIIDSLSECGRMHGLRDENSSTEITGVLRAYRRLAHLTGWAIVFVHHYRKSGDTMRGTSALQAASTGWWDVRHRQRDSEVRQIDVILRNAPKQSLGVELMELPNGGWELVRHESPGWMPKGEEDGAHGGAGASGKKGSKRSPDSIRDQILSVMVQNAQKRWSLDELSGPDGVRARKATVSGIVNALMASGLVGYENGSGYKLAVMNGNMLAHGHV